MTATQPPDRASVEPSSRRRTFRSLRVRNFRLFIAGQLLSTTGTWMQAVAGPWLVLQLTHDPLWLGIVSVAQFGPVILFGLFPSRAFAIPITASLGACTRSVLR